MSKEEKANVLIPFSVLDDLESFTDEERGKILFDAILFARDGVLPEYDSRDFLLVFNSLRRYIEWNEKRYEEQCAQNSENGKKGGRPPKSESKELQQAAPEVDKFFSQYETDKAATERVSGHYPN